MDNPQSSDSQELKNKNFRENFSKQLKLNRKRILYSATFFIGLAAIYLPMNPASLAKFTIIIIAITFGILGILLMVDEGEKLPRVLDPIRKPVNLCIAVYALGSALWMIIEACVE